MGLVGKPASYFYLISPQNRVTQSTSKKLDELPIDCYVNGIKILKTGLASLFFQRYMIHSLNKFQGQPLEKEKKFASIDTVYQYWHFLIHQVVKLGQSQKIRFGLQRTGLIFLPAVMLVLLTVACGSSDPATETPTKSNEAAQAPAVSPINVQTTTTVLADMARVIGGDLIEATSLVPPGADVHIYQVSPSQMLALREASLIISNGCGLAGVWYSAA